MEVRDDPTPWAHMAKESCLFAFLGPPLAPVGMQKGLAAQKRIKPAEAPGM